MNRFKKNFLESDNTRPDSTLHWDLVCDLRRGGEGVCGREGVFEGRGVCGGGLGAGHESLEAYRFQIGPGLARLCDFPAG